jgi:aryl-alcohol dehydrogenase-like predicted oxidoreductase
MKFFRFGKQLVSKISLGTWSLGGDTKGNISYGNITSRKAQQILEYAFNKGINFFDTANVYGEAEKRVGKFIKNKDRKKFLLATKIGCISYDKKKNFSPEIISKQVKNSIKLFNDSYIDLVQLYGPKTNDKILPYTIEKLVKFKNKKLINKIGISLQNPVDYLILRKLHKFDFVQCNFNLLDTRVMDKQIYDKMLKDKVKIFTRTVLNFGIFTEEFLKNKTIFKKNDHRKKWDKNQILSWEENLKIIKQISKRKIENTCYKFSNSFKFSGIIIGATEKSHINCAILHDNFSPLKKFEKINIINVAREFNKGGIKKPFIAMKN